MGSVTTRSSFYFLLQADLSGCANLTLDMQFQYKYDQAHSCFMIRSAWESGGSASRRFTLWSSCRQTCCCEIAVERFGAQAQHEKSVHLFLSVRFFFDVTYSLVRSSTVLHTNLCAHFGDDWRSSNSTTLCFVLQFSWFTPPRFQCWRNAILAHGAWFFPKLASCVVTVCFHKMSACCSVVV